MAGKNIRIFLIEGTPNQRLYCELSNWNGRVYRIPRNEIKISEDRRDLLYTSAYVLLGKNDDGAILAYIGECDNARDRLLQHLKQKDFWNEVIVFIRTDNSLNKAHVKYIEKRLYDIANEMGRCILVNGNQPGGASISESDAAEIDEYIDNARILTNALGIKIFEPVISVTQTPQEKEANSLFLQGARGADASGQKTQEGFVVYKDSKVANSCTPTMPEHYKNLRQELLGNGVIENNIFTKDFLFASPSAAAAIVMGRSANGLTEWKSEEGETLKILLSKE